MKRQIRLAVMMLGLSAVARAQDRAELPMPPSGDNQRAEVSQWIGLVRVTVAYHSPRIHFQDRERTDHIWGELIPFGLFDEGFGPSHATPWRAGANETTSLTLSHDVVIDGKPVKAGTYGVFIELAKDSRWTWILTSNPGWGSFQYLPSEVVLRVAATPTEAPLTEFLTYGFDERLPNAATLYMQWEKKHVALKIDVPNVNELYALQMQTDLRAWAGFNYQNWQAAAQFAASNNVMLDSALVWANRAISEPFRNAAAGQEDFATLSTKASVLTAMGRMADADTVMDRAIAKPDASAGAIYRYEIQALNAGRKERALAVALENRRLHPQDVFMTSVGLARAYTATGDKKHAIEAWERALKNIDPQHESSRAGIERALKTLRGTP